MGRRAISQAARRRLDQAVDGIRALVPPAWEISVLERSESGGVLRFRSPAGARDDVVVLARDRIDPQGVRALPTTTGPTAATARWLSPRTQDLLRERGVGYIDTTGNIELALLDAGIFVSSKGAIHDPQPRATRGPTLRGPKAWAALRTIVEVRPPYGVRELASTLDIDQGYVSRLLRALEDELLIERTIRGPVDSVEWEGVLRKLATTYSVFDGNDTSTWVAPGGPEQFLRDLTGKRAGPWAVSGSFGAARLAPVAAPEVAFVYAEDAERVAKAGRLLPATRGANVVLAVPFDSIVFERTSRAEDATYASTAQLAVDCLTGSGRVPAEGEALVAWMRRNLSRWQAGSLTSPAGDVA